MVTIRTSYVHVTLYVLLYKQIQAVTHTIHNELCQLESKVRIHKSSAERLENNVKLMEKNLADFKLEIMVCVRMYQYVLLPLYVTCINFLLENNFSSFSESLKFW